MKVTKKAKKEFMKSQLKTNQKWALKALIKIYNNQTDDEKYMEATVVDNGIGFTGADAEILSSFADQYLRRGRLSHKQMNIVMKKMHKYWRQLVQISDQQMLEQMIAKRQQQTELEV